MYVYITNMVKPPTPAPTTFLETEARMLQTPDDKKYLNGTLTFTVEPGTKPDSAMYFVSAVSMAVLAMLSVFAF
jgi:hypothetical protein